MVLSDKREIKKKKKMFGLIGWATNTQSLNLLSFCLQCANGSNNTVENDDGCSFQVFRGCESQPYFLKRKMR